MATCPCKDCDQREIGCHAKCDLYNSWKQIQQQAKSAYYKSCNPIIREGDFLGDDAHMRPSKLLTIKRRKSGKSSGIKR